MKANPLISVLIPIYNGEKYLSESITSIIKQDYQNFELILVDDKSTDNSLVIAKQHQKEDSRVKVLCNEKNLGLPATLNKAIEASLGRYIVRLDQDDIAEPQRLEFQIKALEANPDIDVLFTNYFRVSDSGIIISSQHFGKENTLIDYIFEKHGCLLHSTMMAKKDVLMQVGGYRTEAYPADDLDLILRLVDNSYNIKLYNRALVKYRMHQAANTIQRFYLLRKKGRYVKHLHALRKDSKAEIEFQTYLKYESIFNLVKDYGAFNFRKAGQAYSNKKYIKMLGYLISGVILNPNYSLNKLFNMNLSEKD